MRAASTPMKQTIKIIVKTVLLGEKKEKNVFKPRTNETLNIDDMQTYVTMFRAYLFIIYLFILYTLGYNVLQLLVNRYTKSFTVFLKHKFFFFFHLVTTYLRKPQDFLHLLFSQTHASKANAALCSHLPFIHAEFPAQDFVSLEYLVFQREHY